MVHVTKYDSRSLYLCHHHGRLLIQLLVSTWFLKYQKTGFKRFFFPGQHIIQVTKVSHELAYAARHYAALVWPGLKTLSHVRVPLGQRMDKEWRLTIKKRKRWQRRKITRTNNAHYLIWASIQRIKQAWNGFKNGFIWQLSCLTPCRGLTCFGIWYNEHIVFSSVLPQGSYLLWDMI